VSAEDLIWLVPALPLTGFVVLVVFGRRLGEPASGWLATLMVVGSFATTVALYLELSGLDGEERVLRQTLFEWLPAGGLTVDLAFLADPLSITMALFVTGVGALIHLYSVGYMHGDPEYPRYFALLNLFVFFMLVLVLGDNLLVTFLGWEGVGLCSYQLISFWFEDMPNAVAGKKAFITNRVGDFGFMVAMFVTFAAVGSLDYAALNGAAAGLATVTASAIALLLFVGAIGKSAQIPLYVWLPDAMAGPTPVSALIHAATMVTSGVYLLVRVAPVITAADPWVSTTIAWVGAATALLAATIAVAQQDIKKVLAYSTISQLGYTVLAIGTGAFIPAIFHVVTHAFFKALLFLGAGSVIHGMDGDQDMRAMGGLRKYLPITAVTFIVGWLAIVGVPPFAGFWSKDEILAFAYDDSGALWLVGLVTALLTAFYMSRQVFMVFFGPERWRDLPGPGGAEPGELVGPGPDHEPHESPWTMTVPLVVLALLAMIGGFVNLSLSDDLMFLEQWLEPVVGEAEAKLTLSAAVQWTLAVVATLVGLAGIATAFAVYIKRRIDAKRIERPVLAHGWYIDETMAKVVGGPGRRSFDLTAAFDNKVIDGAVNGVAVLVQGAGDRLRAVQSGYVRNYALTIAIGTLLLIGFVLASVNL
jgi:NADH-quinone oxidoreductase subunit L